ncbi:MAG TPA: hypothetical protein VHG71_09390 [Verrucomicrobiae bacterium]|nr:hypothetical protein [Verrucomicrobiae bacterium]
MNRSILIVICDFLLLSLLTFSTDLTKMAGEGEGAQPTVKADVATNQVDTSGKDLADVMKMALTEEQKNRAQLQAELAKAREAAQQQQTQLNQSATQNQQLQQQQANLQQQLAAALVSAKNLNQQLQNSSAEASLTKQQLAEKEAEAQKQAQLANSLQQQLAQFAKSNQVVQTEKQQLSNQLQLAEAEKRAAGEKFALMQQQYQAEHAENLKLAEGFNSLATNSSALTREIRENRPLTANAIFNDFTANQVQASFNAARTGFLGMDASKSKSSQTALATDGKNIYALCHVQDTPLTLWDPGTDWDGLTGTLRHGSAQVPIHSLSFNQQDPRVVFMPLTSAEAAQLGGKVYKISSDPYKFQDAVLVGAQQGYYGECGFQVDLETPNYVKLDRSLLKGLFGKFNPSSGDLVFSRSGELLGVMVNGTYCLVLKNFNAAATFQFGQDVTKQHTGDTLARLYGNIFNLPLKLQ